MLHDIPSLLPPAQRARLAVGERLTTPVPAAGGGVGQLVWHHWRPEAGAARVDAPPLVLFHGGSGSWTHWIKNIVPLLGAGRTVLAADLPGFGESTLLEGGNEAHTIAPVLAQGLRALLQGTNCDLVGFSFGSVTAALMLADAPDLARRLVLVGAPAMGIVTEHAFEIKPWRQLKTEAEQEAVHRHNLGALMLHAPCHIDGLALQVHTANVRRDRALRRRRRLSRTDVLSRTLPRLHCPVHAIYGEHDVFYQGHFDLLERAFAAAAPDFRGLTRVAGAGHWVQFEAPEAFDTALLRALEG